MSKSLRGEDPTLYYYASIPRPLAAGFPPVRSPWGEGQGEGVKVVLLLCIPRLLASGVIDLV